MAWVFTDGSMIRVQISNFYTNFHVLQVHFYILL